MTIQKIYEVKETNLCVVSYQDLLVFEQLQHAIVLLLLIPSMNFTYLTSIQNDKSDNPLFLARLHRINLEPSSSMVKESAPIEVQAVNSAGIQ
jgi:hypothetical protein